MSVDEINTEQLAPLEALEALLPSIPQAKERKQLGVSLGNATAQAEKMEALVAALDSNATLLSLCAVDLGDDRGPVSGSLDTILQFARLAENAETAAQLDQVTAQRTQIEFQVGNITERVQRAWSERVRKDLGGYAGLGAVLGRIESTAELGSNLGRLGQHADLLKRPTGPDAQRIAEHQRLAAQRDKLIADLGKAGIEADIVAFLNAIAQGSVSLAQVTRRIYDWLEEHDALPLFAASLVPPSRH